MTALLRLWHALTAPRAKDPDRAQQEYLTRSILVILAALCSAAALSILVGWGFGLFPPRSVLITLLVDLTIILAYRWAAHQRVVLAGYIPTAVFIGLAFYLTYRSTFVPLGPLISTIAILLAAMLQGIKTQWLVAAFSAAGHLTIAILRYDYAAADIVAFGITISCTFAGTALLVGLYIRQLQHLFVNIRLSEEHIHNLFERVPVGLYRTTPEGRILDANPAMVEMLGFPDLETLLGVPSSSLFMDPVERVREKALLEQEAIVHDFEMQLRRYDGSPIWVRDTVRIIQDAQGNVLYYEGSLEDVTARKTAELELKMSEAHYRAIVEDQTELICRFLPDCSLTFVNEAYCREFGQKREQLLGQSFVQFVLDEDRPLLAARLAAVSPDDPAVTIENRVVKAQGEIRWQQWTNRAIYDQANLIEFQAVGRDITEQKKAEEYLKFLATHDPLTNLPNRVILYECMRNALERARRIKNNHSEKYKLAVMMLDMDNFKEINDSHGHTIGDTVLQAIAERVRGCIRMSDTVARVGGDEFILVIEGLADPMDATLVAQKILSVVAEPFLLDGQEHCLSASIGISLSPKDGENTEILLKNADTAMYRAKEKRNCFCYYSETEEPRAAQEIGE